MARRFVAGISALHPLSMRGTERVYSEDLSGQTGWASRKDTLNHLVHVAVVYVNEGLRSVGIRRSDSNSNTKE